MLIIDRDARTPFCGVGVSKTQPIKFFHSWRALHCKIPMGVIIFENLRGELVEKK